MAGSFPRRTVLAAMTAATVLAVPLAAQAATGVVPATPVHGVGFNDEVTAVAYHDGTAYVGGNFGYAVAGTNYMQRDYLAAVHAGTGKLAAWAPTVNGAVTAIAVSGDRVFLGGDFTEVDGQPRRHLAAVRTDTGAVTGFDHSLGSAPCQLAAGGGQLYAVGDFSSVDNRSWAHVAAFSLSTGTLRTRFHPTTDGTVRAVAVSGDRVYLGGVFHTINGSGAHPRVAAVNADTGATVAAFAGGSPVIAYQIAAGNQGVYAALGGAGGRIAAYTPAGKVAWSLTTDGDVHNVGVMHGIVYGGGHFDHACTTSRVATVHGTCLDGSVRRQKLFATNLSGKLLGWAPQANSIQGVLAMVTDPAADRLAVGGDFTAFGTGTTQQHFAQFG
jgi:hypothetical protein